MPPMGRLLQLLLFIALVVIAVRAIRRMLAPPPAGGPAAAPPSFEATGRCSKCGTFVPRRELDNASLCFDCRTRQAPGRPDE